MRVVLSLACRFEPFIIGRRQLGKHMASSKRTQVQLAPQCLMAARMLDTNRWRGVGA